MNKMIKIMKTYNLILMTQYAIYLYLSISTNDRILIISDITIMLFLLTCFLIDYTRKKYYFAGISEISDHMYWVAVCLSQSGIVALFYSMQANPEVIRYLNALMAVVMIMLIITFYQTKPWILNDLSDAKKRASKLIRKAKLSELEFKVIRDEILKNAVGNDNPPPAWSIYKIIIAFILASVINAYAQPLMHFLRDQFLKGPN